MTARELLNLAPQCQAEKEERWRRERGKLRGGDDLGLGNGVLVGLGEKFQLDSTLWSFGES